MTAEGEQQISQLNPLPPATEQDCQKPSKSEAEADHQEEAEEEQEEEEEARGEVEDKEESELGLQREAKRRKTCPAALDKISPGTTSAGAGSTGKTRGSRPCQGGGGGAMALAVGEEEGGADGSFLFSFDTRGVSFPIGTTPKFGSFPSVLYSSAAAVAVSGGGRGEGENGTGGEAGADE